MDRATFENDDNWLGSYYELCLQLGPVGDDARLTKAVAQLWSQPQLHGSWINRTSYNDTPPPIEIVDGFLQPRYGLITLTSGQQIGCVTHTVRETDGSDWLDLCIPTGMLELAFDTRYPLDYAANPWMRAVDRDLAQIGASMFHFDGYLLGIIGEEASGLTDSGSITADDCRHGPFLFPESLWLSLDLQCRHSIVASGLVAIGLRDPE